MRLGSWQPKEPPHFTLIELFIILVYLLFLWLVMRAGYIGWACLLMLPLLAIIVIVILWDDLDI